MAFDEALLENMPRWRAPVLRFYGWTEPAASFGYFQKYAEVERLSGLRPLVRRPTGGGLVPHDADWTYSLSFPAGHEWYQLSAKESYGRVHFWLKQTFARLKIETDLAPRQLKSALGQCFVGHEQADLLWRGRKIAGAAQRRRKEGLLIQGSVQPPSQGPSRAEWQKAMRAAAVELWATVWSSACPDDALRARAAELTEAKYSRDSYNQQR